MSGALRIDLRRLLPFRQRLMMLSHLRLGRLYQVLGSEVESQTRRRITDEKTDPDGEPWDAWSEAYAAVRKPGGGILDLGGDLVDSIDFEISGHALIVGSNLVYALVHQEGHEDLGIPARPYLGISEENGEDLQQLAVDFVAREARL